LNGNWKTPYNLVFDSKVVLSLEVQLPFVRVAIQFTGSDENTRVRSAKLEAFDKHRLMAH